MRDTGGGFGQKVVPMREDMCIMLAARKVPAALKWIEDRRENLMSAGQARHVDGTARMAFDDDGNILAADIDFIQDVGAYPTPYPVFTTAADRDVLPRPVPGPEGQLRYKTVFSNTSGLAAYRGPWQYETLAREILLDIAARKMDVDPVELRRRNLLRGDEMPYVNPNGMPYDHVAPADTFEQAVKILDHEGFRKEQSDALAQGRYIGLGFSAYIEPTGAATGHLATEGATIRIEPTGKINVYVNGGSTRQQHRDHRRPADRRRARCRHRRRRHDPGRHRGDAVRGRHSGQPQRADDGRRGQRGRHRCCASRSSRWPPTGWGSTKPTSSWPARGPASANDPAKSVSFADLAYRAYYEPQQLPPGMSAVAGGDRAVHLAGADPLGQRDARVHLRGGRQHRPRRS